MSQSPGSGSRSIASVTGDELLRGAWLCFERLEMTERHDHQQGRHHPCASVSPFVSHSFRITLQLGDMDSRPYAGARKVHALEESPEAGVGAEGVGAEGSN